MLSYKKWKTLNESFDCNLGISQTQSLGVSSDAGPTLDEFLALLDEKKKMKKKMLGEKPNLDLGDDDETGDGEVVEPSSLKDKKVVDDEDMGDDDDDMGDDDDMDDDMGGDDDGAELDMSKLKGLSGDKLMMMKKKLKAKMKKKMTKKMKKEDVEPTTAQTVEQDAWLQSITNMMQGSNGPNWDGFGAQNEDALIPLSDPNQHLEIKPGDIGYAPQGRVGGDFFGSL